MLISARKKYKLNNKKIAKLAGYRNEYSFNSSSAKGRILALVDSVIEHVENEIVNKIHSG